MYDTNSQNKFGTSMLKSPLCDYSDAYILLSRTITFFEKEQTMQQEPQIEIINKQYSKIVHRLLTA